MGEGLLGEILYPVIILTGIAIAFSILIAIFSKKFAVKKDIQVEAVGNLLAGANCGACGYAGCEDFARALVKGEAKVSGCNATNKENKKKISALLGSDSSDEETVVVCGCVGGILCEDKYEYQGYGDCVSVELLSGGRKSCPTGCIGMSTCVSNCPVHAIDIIKGVARINQDKCIHCGVCILHCPKTLMKRIPKKAKYFIACSCHLVGKDVRINCKAGCIGCGICAKVCPEGAITLVDNLPVFDYDKCVGCGICAEKCPAKCIKELVLPEEKDE